MHVSTTMHVSSDQLLDDDVRERRFTVGEVPGILWTGRATTARADAVPSDPAPLILLGHPGGVDQMYPRLVGRARHYVAEGFAAATIELPGGGDRPRLPAAEQARADLRRALEAGEPVDAIVDRLVVPLVEQAVPEWQAALDAFLGLPEVRGPVGCEGGVTAVGVRLARVEPRIAAAVLFAGTFVPTAMLGEARAVHVPTLVLLPWDDERNDRQRSLELFDALGSAEKTLHANTGGHTGTPRFELEDAARFFQRHLR